MARTPLPFIPTERRVHLRLCLCGERLVYVDCRYFHEEPEQREVAGKLARKTALHTPTRGQGGQRGRGREKGRQEKVSGRGPGREKDTPVVLVSVDVEDFAAIKKQIDEGKKSIPIETSRVQLRRRPVRCGHDNRSKLKEEEVKKKTKLLLSPFRTQQPLVTYTHRAIPTARRRKTYLTHAHTNKEINPSPHSDYTRGRQRGRGTYTESRGTGIRNNAGH